MIQLTFENCATCSHHYKDVNGNIRCKDWDLGSSCPSWIKVGIPKDETEPTPYCLHYSKECKTVFLVTSTVCGEKYVPDICSNYLNALDFLHSCIKRHGYSLDELEIGEYSECRQISEGDDLRHVYYYNDDDGTTFEIKEFELRGGDN